jgi:hypothetical protein
MYIQVKFCLISILYKFNLATPVHPLKQTYNYLHTFASLKHLEEASVNSAIHTLCE